MSSEERSFRIRGMDCADEIATLKREVGPLVGGEDHLAFDLLNGKMIVRGADDVGPQTIIEAIERAGMKGEPWRDTPPGRVDRDRSSRAVLTGVSGAFSLGGFLVHLAIGGAAALGSEGSGLTEGNAPFAAKALYLAGIAAGTYHVVPRAALAARRLRPDMNLLMAVAVVGAVAIGEWFEAATVSFLFSLSLALEAWSVERARRAVRALMTLAPPTVRTLQDGREQDVPPESVVVGTRFVVRPGERIALDGTVVRGNSEVNQAPITGESSPVPKIEGEPVYAGTVNGDGALEVECTKLATDTTLAHIVRTVADAQSRRAASEQWVEAFARYYTPAVLAIALIVVLALPAAGRPWADAIYRALVLLVIGCPCALVISTPVTIVAALAAAAKNGVLIKGGLHLEVPGRLVALAIDKTGTLTEGRPSVVELVPLEGHTAEEVLSLATAIELRSEHPLARAIVAYASGRGPLPVPAEDVQTIQGKGVTATISGRRFWLGSHRLLEERGQETAEVHERLVALSSAGRSVVILGDDAHACGFIALADAVRRGTGDVIRELKAAGIQHVAMLTGDNRGTAEAVARETQVDAVHAELLPADKVTTVEALVTRFGRVGMVGDGINDAPALARASLGIAMGGAGSDAAIETADVTLMADDLERLPWLVRHSRRALRIVRQNITFSLAVKAVFVVLTFLGHASLWSAIAADMGASLAVIANGLRLLRRERTPRLT